MSLSTFILVSTEVNTEYDETRAPWGRGGVVRERETLDWIVATVV